LDDGHAISYQALRRGTVVRSSDGVELGKVRRVEEETRSHIFDGIVMDTPAGRRFLDAPEVARIAERAVTTTFPAAEADQHLADVGSRLGKLASNTTTARRAKRLGRNLRSRWDRR
jgi:septum formation inhibitor-activating ATPase MinD